MAGTLPDFTKSIDDVGPEFEPDQKPAQNKEVTIKFFLDAFNWYIANNVDWKDLVMVYEYFNPDQRKTFKNVGKNTDRPEDVVMAIFDEIDSMTQHADRYTKLVEAFKECDYSKVVSILEGQNIPAGDKARDLIFKKSNKIRNFLLTGQILPNLMAKNVISDRDAQLLRAKEREYGRSEATFELLFLLPVKHKHWFRLFMEALIEVKQDGLAEEIDADYCRDLKLQLEEGGEVLDTDPYASCMPIEGEKKAKEVPKDDGSIHEHVVQDSQQPSVMMNNLSPFKLDELASLDSEAAKRSLDFSSLQQDEDNVRLPEAAARRQSGAQSGSPNSTTTTTMAAAGDQSTARLSLGHNAVPSGGQNSMPSLGQSSGGMESFSSLMNFGGDTTHQPRSQMPDQGLPQGCNDLGPTERFVEGAENDDNDRLQVLRKPQSMSEPELVSFDMDNTDPKQIAVEGYGAGAGARRKDSNLLGGGKEFKDKNMLDGRSGVGAGGGAMNITSAESLPAPEPEEGEEFEDTDISLRKYQEELATPAMRGKNVIIVAPTGSGKTRVAMRIIQEHIRQQKDRGIAKVIFLVNQVALANQQYEACQELLPQFKSKVISGESQRSKNECLKDFINKRDILIVTAQVLLDALVQSELPGINVFSLMVFDECHHTHANHAFNQIMGTYMKLKFTDDPKCTVSLPQVLSMNVFSLMVFDECHHTHANHAFNQIMGTYMKLKFTDDPKCTVSLPQIVGLTASVGVGKAKNIEKAMGHIKSLMANLDAEIISTVNNNMEELRSFVSLPDEETCTVPKRENDMFGANVIKLINIIETRMASAAVVKEVAEAAQFEPTLKAPAQKGNAAYTQWVSRLSKETAKLRSQEARRFLYPCRAHLNYYNNALIIHNDARVEDALGYLEGEMTAWRDTAAAHMDDNEKRLNDAYDKIKKLGQRDKGTNPKLEKLREMIVKVYRSQGGGGADSRGIVFVKTRDLAKAIVNWMKDTPGLRELNPIPFLGQNSSSGMKGGMTKVEQVDALQYFKEGKHKLIVATSVAEEGLDISKCNLVIRYDHVTNEIAMVQSRGRGRAADSQYIVIAEKGTGMAEKEELNMIREILMRKAIIQLQEDIIKDPAKFKKQLHSLQDEANVDRRLKALGRKGKLIRTGEFELRCFKCDNFICMSSEIKKIEGAHHVIADMANLRDRVTFMKMEPMKYQDGVTNCGKQICKGCGETLGPICIYRSLEFPVAKIEKFLIVDMNGHQNMCQRWKQAPFEVGNLSHQDFIQIINERDKTGDLETP